MSCLATTRGIPENRHWRGATKECCQAARDRAVRTTAAIKQLVPALRVGGVTVKGLRGLSQAIDELAQRCDGALANFDAAGNGENNTSSPSGR